MLIEPEQHTVKDKLLDIDQQLDEMEDSIISIERNIRHHNNKQSIKTTAILVVAIITLIINIIP